MDNNLFRIVQFHNPDDEALTIIYNKEPVRTIQPGETVAIVKMWSDNGAKHLADRIMRKNGQNLLNKEDRAKVVATIILSEEGSLLGTQPSQNQLADQLINKATNPTANPNQWKFDPLTGKPLPAEPQPELPQPVPTPTHTNPEIAGVMAGVTTQQGTGSLPAQDLTREEAPPAPRDKSNDTKEQVLSWIVNNLPVNYNSDPETKSRLDAMDVDELKREFKYESLAA